MELFELLIQFICVEVCLTILIDLIKKIKNQQFNK